MLAAAMLTGIQSTHLFGSRGSAEMDGCADVENMMGHISDVFQCPVTVEPHI